jgi:hypothetical protein
VETIDRRANDNDPLEGVVGRHSVDYLLRNVHQQLVQLSAQADLKANIILTASVLVLSVGIARVDSSAHRWTLIVLGVGVFGALLFAIGAVLPTIPIPGRKPPPPKDPDVLFFAHFAHMDEQSFERELGSALHDDAEVYRLLIRNLHGQARYLLTKKYRLIRWSYICFVIGIVGGGIAELVRFA